MVNASALTLNCSIQLPETDAYLALKIVNVASKRVAISAPHRPFATLALTLRLRHILAAVLQAQEREA